MKQVFVVIVGSVVLWIIYSLLSKGLNKGASAAAGYFEQRSPGMPILRSAGVDANLAGLCEDALSSNSIEVHGSVPNGRHLISFVSDGLSFVAVVEVQSTPGLRDGILIGAVYPVGHDGLSATLLSLREAYGIG